MSVFIYAHRETLWSNENGHSTATCTVLGGNDPQNITQCDSIYVNRVHPRPTSLLSKWASGVFLYLSADYTGVFNL